MTNLKDYIYDFVLEVLQETLDIDVTEEQRSEIEELLEDRMDDIKERLIG